MTSIRAFVLGEAASFIAAALIHSGVLITGYEHQNARIAESVIAIVLLAGLPTGWIRPAWARAAALGAQTFALLGTLVGIIMIVIGVGPRTVPDVIYHICIVLVLACGLAVTVRTQS